ncbi:hypothetical protein B0T22DRAFT_490466 [Podospora appendiculata]|uniref:AAA+ ATPase domain-containing protein n=1 Tax=Podospora appendiculata TaxID=314037 RepID=A0AAE1CCU3_9PEZI|nr:hypothetical protein B0T22DRAFT_490466 [Podospora appendiculata]
MASDQLQVVELMEKYKKLGLASQPGPRDPLDDDEDDGGVVPGDEAPGNAWFQPPELARILELPRSSGYGTRTVKLDSFDEQVDLNDGDEEFAHYTILMRREINQYGRVRKLQLEIQSPRLRAIFRDKAQQFHDINTEANPIVIPAPYHVLFFLYKQLRDISETKDTDKLTREELKLLVQYMRSRECLGVVFDKWESLVPLGKISFDILWTLFPPYKMLYFHRDDDEGCYLLEYCQPVLTAEGGIQGLFNVVRGAYDNDRFGVEKIPILIPSFQGIKSITTADLEIIPFEQLPTEDQKAVKERLIGRTHEWLRLQRAPYTYLELRDGSSYNSYEERSEEAMHMMGGRVKSMQENSNGRIIIDQVAFEDRYPEQSPDFAARNIRDFMSRQYKRPDDDSDRPAALGWNVPDLGYPQAEHPRESTTEAQDGHSANQDAKPGSPRAAQGIGDATQKDDIAEEDMMICDHYVHGFLLDKQKWVRVHVKYLEPTQFYPNTWDTLQLSSEKKDVIYAMVTGFLQETKASLRGWEQVIIKKGNGLLFLLHGEPGLGKTYTVECLSEKTRRPLYRVTTAELGTQADSFEKRLSRVFKLGHRWRAVVLLDEADIIMAARDKNNLERNALVGVFLRLMEYYEGLLFMTTNRFTDLDTAFRNRIHATIEYTVHEKPARKNIWRQVLEQNMSLPSRPEEATPLSPPEDASASETRDAHNASEIGRDPHCANDMACDILAELDCNGREIRNMVRAAVCIANSEETVMGPQHVVRVIKSLSTAGNKTEVIPHLEKLSEW